MWRCEHNWLVAQVEAQTGSSLRTMVGDAFHDDVVDLARPSLGARALRALKTALSFRASYDTAGSWTFGLDLGDVDGGGADTGSLDVDLAKLLRDLSGAAEEQGVGVAVLIDEAQDLSAPELTAVCSIAHAASQRQDRVIIVLAGLPSLPRELAEAKSYAERLFSYRSISALDHQAAHQALIAPAADEGVSWHEDAVALLVRESRGYPYFLQQYGQDTWNAGTSRA